MTSLQIGQETVTDPSLIAKIMTDQGCLYERWGTRSSITHDADVLREYQPEIEALSKSRQYQSSDLVALRPDTPNLDVICAKFDKEHHHLDDEVRFVVEGEGIFDLEDQRQPGKFIRITTVAGDLIVIPAMRRHAFYLTEKKHIRCIRLFKDTKGWEAIYEKP